MLKFFPLLWLFFSCQDKAKYKLSKQKNPEKKIITVKPKPKPKTPMYQSLLEFQTIQIGKHQVDIAVPPKKTKIIGNILVLQGFAFPKDDWCKKSSLCQKALEKGYRLIMPEMGKSTYSTKFYPETRQDWKKYPQRGWLVNEVFSHLQSKYGIFLPKEKNYIIGLSTGARGVALVAIDKPNLFTACAGLSGDYDQTQMRKDKVLIGYYGAYNKHPKRWAEEDNILHLIAQWRTPIYIGHGLLDKVTLANQSKIFYKALEEKYPNLPKKLNISPIHEHNYTYWDYEVDHILDFFQTVSTSITTKE